MYIPNLNNLQAYVSLKHQDDKVISYERAGLVFIFNFHPTKSFTDYRIGVEAVGEYKVVLNTDSPTFMGHGRIDEKGSWFSTPEPWNNRKNFIQVCLMQLLIFFMYIVWKNHELNNEH
jgi:1,4-alpha-glucan branching enzyme